MSDEIKPALTAEQWRDVLSGDADAYNVRSQVELRVASDALRGELTRYCPDRRFAFVGAERHALAALALHGQPFGFTREDVALLRVTAAVNESGSPVWAVGLRYLAARIAAFLPPEDGG